MISATVLTDCHLWPRVPVGEQTREQALGDVIGHP